MERKVKLTIIILSLIGIITSAIVIPIIIFLPKVSFEKQIVDENFSAANFIDYADLDNDDDLDIFGCAYYDNEIAWWEFSEGSFIKHIIDTTFSQVIHVHAVDLDKDGDKDLLATSEGLDQLAWWENIGANFTKHVITDTYDHPLRINSIDFDHDGDIDILSTSNAEVSWWENDGTINFTRHAISADPTATINEHHHFIYAIDLNKDGFLDLVTGGASTNYGGLFYWRNEGNVNFTKVVVTNNYNRVHEVRTRDVDKDGDVDVVCGSFSSNELDWFENRGNFNLVKHAIASDFNGANGGYPCDLDNDGDIDVIGMAYEGNKLSWFENTGFNNFNEHIISEDLPRITSCCALDIDGDSDLDILTAAGNEIAFWENTLV